MRRKRLLRGVLSGLVILLGATSVGFSAWTANVAASASKSVKVATTPERVVCYKGSNKYTTIEKALSEAVSGDKIYVLPNLKNDDGSIYEIKITSNCTIKSGVTLELPYEDDGSSSHNISVINNFDRCTAFADQNSTNVNTYRKTLVSIAEGKTLTIESGATMEIGAIIGGSADQKPSGYVKSSYCELLMGSNSKIENHGTMNIYGYIKENTRSNNGSVVRHYSGSKVQMPLVVYDYRGGSYSYAANNADVMPFNHFDFPNCQAFQQYDYGSSMTGFVGLYIGEQKLGSITLVKEGCQNASATVIGSDSSCLFSISDSSGYLTLKYTPANRLYTTNDVKKATVESNSNITTVHTYGKIMISSFKLNLSLGLANVPIDTSKLFCPISYKFRIFVDQGEVIANTKIKFTGGSSLTIGKNGIFTANKDVIFYRNYVPIITTGGNDIYPATHKDATLINNGILNINSNFGGFVGTSEEGGIINVSSSISGTPISVSSNEALTSSGGGLSEKVTSTDTHVENASAIIFENEDVDPSEQNLVAGKIYKSVGSYWQAVGKDILAVKLSISGGESEPGTAKTYNIKANLNPDPYDSTEVNYDWQCDIEGATITGQGTSQISFTTPANTTYEDIKYTLTCVVTFKLADGSGTGVVETFGEFVAKRSVDIGTISISPSSGESESGKSKTYSITASLSPTPHNSTGVSYTWSCPGATITGTGDKITLVTPENKTNVDIEYDLTCVVHFVKADGTPATLTANGKYIATKVGDITGISLTSDPSSAKTPEGEAQDFKVTAKPVPDIYGSTIIEYSWILEGKKLGSTSSSVTFTIQANSDTEEDVEYTLECVLTFTKMNGQQDTVSEKKIFTAAHAKSGGGGGCFAGNTEIMMLDGTTKLAKDIKQFDMVATFDHNRGCMSYSPVAYVFRLPNYTSEKLTVSFDNGNVLEIIDAHGLFDIKANEYVILSPNNIEDYIGHDFYCLDIHGCPSSTKLVSYECSKVVEDAYSILTAYDINCFANGFLNVSDEIEGLYNYFELDENMKVDEVKKQRDIELYGLAKYEEWSDYCTEEEFEVFNCQYLNIAIGKGLTTRESLIERMLRFTGKSA